MSSLQLAWLNLSRKAAPSLLAILCIAISVACSGVLLRLYTLSSSRFATLAPGGDAIVGAKSSGSSILLGSLNQEGVYPGYVPYNLFNSLRKMETVQFEDSARSEPAFIEAVIPFLYFARVESFRVIGTDESFIHRPIAVDNPILSDGAWFKAPGEVVVGSDVAFKKSLRLGDVLSALPWTAGEPSADPSTKFDFKVVGIFKAQGTAIDRGIYGSLHDAQEVIAMSQRRHPGRDARDGVWSANVLNYFYVYLRPNGLEKLSTLINHRTIAQVVSVKDELDALHELTGTGHELGLFMTCLILILSWLAVVSMMVTRFDAMHLQISVLRALGFARGSIRNWLIWEGVFLGASACLFGAFLDWLIFPWLRMRLGNSLPLEVVSPLWTSAPVWACAFLATILAVFLPLFRIFRRDVHSSLTGV